jgi:Tfp pilus assembly protein PilO
VRTQGVVFLLLTCSLVAAVWRGWLAPERLLLDSRRSRLAASITERARLRVTTAGLPGLQREVRTLEAKVAAMKPLATDQAAGSEEHILQTLDDLAKRSGVTIAAFSEASSANEKDLKQRRVNLILEGSFNGVLTFIDGLVSLGRIGSIIELAIKPQTKAGGRPAVAATVVAEVREAAAAFARPESALESGELLDGRDPFVDPGLGGAASPGAANQATNTQAPAGLAAMSVDDVSVTGIARAGARMTAVLQGANRQTFVVHALDRLLDATVAAIDDAGVVFVRKTSRKPEVVRKNLGKITGAVR